MPAAYIVSPGSVVRSAPGVLEITAPEHESPRRVPLHLIWAVIAWGRVSVTSPAVTTLARHAIPLAYLRRSGEFLGRLTPPTPPEIDIRRAQYALLGTPEATLVPARGLVRRKLLAQAETLQRFLSNHPDAELRALRTRLLQHADVALHADRFKSLLGIEGAAGSDYFRALTRMNRSELPFAGRSRRPPGDPVNALLSFGYSLLTQEAWALAEALGLDPWMGIYHAPNRRRPALVMDIIEPFRHAVVDRAVLAAINRGRFCPDDFRSRRGGTFLSRDGVARLCEVFEGAMQQCASEEVRPPTAAADASAREALLTRCEEVRAWLRKRAQRDTPPPGGPAPDAAETA